MSTLEELMEKFELPGSLRFDHEHFKKEVNMAQVEEEEAQLYDEFEELAKQGAITERDLHTKIKTVIEHGKELYKRAFKHNPNIFSEKTAIYSFIIIPTFS